MIGLIGYIIFGLIVGALARLLLPGRDPMGCFATAVLGIVGSLLGGFVAGYLFKEDIRDQGYHFRKSWIASILGAMLLLWIWRMIQRSRS